MSKSILITGGTGLIGTRLTELLKAKNYQVRYLSRKSGAQNGVRAYTWDIENQSIDKSAFEGVTDIIHLAGAGVVDKKWTTQRKNQILNSRTQSTELIHDTLKSISHSIETFISASGVGYYGWDTGGKLIREESGFGDDFLATVTKAWEERADSLTELGIRTVKLRIGVVFSDKGAALYELAKPIKWGVGAPLGSGDQYMSWIHIDDLCNMFIHAIENRSINGVYNAVSPNPDTNKKITREVGKVLKRPVWLPNVPGFILKLILGQRASMVLGGSRVSSEKIESTGFKFSFPNLTDALKDLLSK